MSWDHVANRPLDPSFLGCHYCRHWRPRTGSCKAFPRRVPLAIVSGQTDHVSPRPDLGQDNEVVFELVPSLEQWEANGFPEERRDP